MIRSKLCFTITKMTVLRLQFMLLKKNGFVSFYTNNENAMFLGYDEDKSKEVYNNW